MIPCYNSYGTIQLRLKAYEELHGEKCLAIMWCTSGFNTQHRSLQLGSDRRQLKPIPTKSATIKQKSNDVYARCCSECMLHTVDYNPLNYTGCKYQEKLQCCPTEQNLSKYVNAVALPTLSREQVQAGLSAYARVCMYWARTVTLLPHSVFFCFKSIPFKSLRPVF